MLESDGEIRRGGDSGAVSKFSCERPVAVHGLADDWLQIAV
jgi:hypothetical protein